MISPENLPPSGTKDQPLCTAMRTMGLIVCLTSAFFLTKEIMLGPVSLWFFIAGFTIGLVVIAASWIPAPKPAGSPEYRPSPQRARRFDAPAYETVRSTGR